MTIRLNVLAIKKMVAEKRMTLAELSKLCGISRQNLSTMLQRGTCSLINAGRLADALGVDVEEIWKEE